MRLLFDENLSFKLTARLADLFPECLHVNDVSLLGESDSAVWEHAKNHGLAIVTTDADFLWKVTVAGPPPKVVLLRRWQYPTRDVEALLRREAIRISEFLKEPATGALLLDKSGLEFPK